MRAFVVAILLATACHTQRSERPVASAGIEHITTGRPVVVSVGLDSKKKRATPWQPGLTLMSTLVITFPDHANFPYHLIIRRGGVESFVDVEQTAMGDATDIPLEPGDEIFIGEDLPFR